MVRSSALLFVVFVAGCGGPPAQEETEPGSGLANIPMSPATPIAEPTFDKPPVRPHNYDEEQDRTYSYIAAVSEDDRKRGVAAGAVSNFRYLGRNANGEHIVAGVTGAGAVKFYSRCSDNCVIIRHSDGEQSAYNPRSIIGAVFEDAINGRLKKWSPPPPPPEVMYFEDQPPAMSSSSAASTPAEPEPIESEEPTPAQPAEEM